VQTHAITAFHRSFRQIGEGKKDNLQKDFYTLLLKAIAIKNVYPTMRHNNTTDQTPPSAELQLAGLIAKLEPKNKKLIKPMRRVLRKRFPTVNELVYDYTKSLVISYSPKERGSDGIVAISADANGVRLPDPHGMLLGDGRQTRYIRIEASKVLLQPSPTIGSSRKTRARGCQQPHCVCG